MMKQNYDSSQEKVVIELTGGRVAVLSILPLDTELDVEDLLRIDYGNIMGEILTFPLVFNRIANLRAEMEEICSRTKLDTDIFEAQLTEEYRKKLGATTEKRVTDTQILSSVQTDARYAMKKRQLFTVQKNLSYLESLYWSAQSKDTKLNRLTEKLRPEEFEKELLEDTINGVIIKIKKSVIN